MNEKAILFDTTKCIGCRACENVCRISNGLDAAEDRVGDQLPAELSINTLLTIRQIESSGGANEGSCLIRISCMHCTEAACVGVCPTGAVFYNEYGAVSFDQGKCIGCGYCTEFCPFNVPRLETDVISGVGKMSKCTLCTAKDGDCLEIGKEPACVQICPTDAIVFADRDELITEAKSRLATLKTSRDRDYSRAMLYGETELGGLHVLYILAEPPEVYGLPASPTLPLMVSVRKVIGSPFSYALWGVTGVLLTTMVIVARANLIRNKGGH